MDPLIYAFIVVEDRCELPQPCPPLLRLTKNQMTNCSKMVFSGCNWQSYNFKELRFFTLLTLRLDYELS